jgi:hypothetical protein
MDFHRFAAKMPNLVPPKNIIWSWFWSEFASVDFLARSGWLRHANSIESLQSFVRLE